MKPEIPNDDILKYILDNFDYDSSTGKLYRFSIKFEDWRECTNNHNSDRYRVGIKYRSYYVSNICWFLYCGKWPVNEIDHKDLNGYNNKINNLRESSYSKNSTNADKRVFNKYHGVTYHDIGKKFRYRFRIEGKQYEVYGFNTAKEAAIAREKHLDALEDTFCARNKDLE